MTTFSILIQKGPWCFYRAERSWGKVIFSEACVKNSVHGGVSRPRPRGQVGGSGQGGCLGPEPGRARGSLGGLAGGSRPTSGVSRPTPRGGVQAHTLGVQAHTQWGPGPHPGGSKPTPGGCPGRHLGVFQALVQGGVQAQAQGVYPNMH